MRMTSGKVRGLGAALLLALAAIAGSRAARELKQDFAVDLTGYSGFWHELARTPNRFQDNEPRKAGKRFSACYQSTADYALMDDGRILVTNACLRKAADDTVIRDVTEGMARVIEGSQNRRLTVAFGPAIARFFQRLLAPSGGNYWIHCLGPEVEGRYSWSVVSDNRKKLVWFLAREASMTEADRAQMTACARQAGLPVEKLVFRQGEETLPT